MRRSESQPGGGPMRSIDHGLNQPGTFVSHQPLNLPDQAALSSFGTERQTRNGEDDDHRRGERQGHVISQRRSHSRRPVILPVPDGHADQGNYFFERKLHSPEHFFEWLGPSGGFREEMVPIAAVSRLLALETVDGPRRGREPFR